ncbi:response regulator [Candidatus Saccharibacteria bacterium]|nr:MAG: response regulator [Candidatus Saccharibacteria bacterium]
MAKLLLVEDDNNLREIYQARLSAEGYDIVTAQNGEEALSVAKQAHPDLIISDVMMPRISGFEMLDILRATPELANTKIIMLTALGQAEDQARANKLGADKYLVKSQVTLEDIVNSVRDLLSGTTMVAPSTVSQPTATTASVQTSPVTADPTSAPTVATPSLVPAPEPSLPGFLPTPNFGSDGAIAAPAPAQNTADPAITADNTTTQTNSGFVTATVSDPDPLSFAQPATPAPQTAESVLPEIMTHSGPVLGASNNTATDTTSDIPNPTVPSVTTSGTEEAPTVPQVAIPSTDDQTAQTLAAEEATVASQIAAFANTIPTESSAAVAPFPETPHTLANEANERTLTAAVDDLAAAVNQPPEPSLPPSQKIVPGEEPPIVTETDNTTPIPPESIAVTVTPEPTDTAATTPSVVTPTPATTQNPVSPDQAQPIVVSNQPAPPQAPPEPENSQVNVAGKKVIRPINNITQGPNLSELLAKEAEKEQASVGFSNAVVGDESQQISAPTAPAAPAAPPAGPTSAPTQTAIDPNSIAL